MTYTYWHKQNPDTPLYPDLLWSRPESKQRAGKLLIIGGNSFGFSAVGEAYAAAVSGGAGSVRVLLPEAIRKVVGRVMEHAEFAASNPSGGFGKEALGELLAQAAWADCVLWAGDLGHNSETTILLEQFLSKHLGQVVLAGDTLDLTYGTPAMVCRRPDTLAVASFAQLQKLAAAIRFPAAFRLGMNLLQLVEALHEFTQKFPAHIVVKQREQLLVASGGNVSSTLLEPDLEKWRTRTASQASVWWLQNPSKTFEALTTAVAVQSPRQ